MDAAPVAPGPPPRPTARWRDGSQHVELTWEAPRASGSGPIHSFVILARRGGEQTPFKRLTQIRPDAPSSEKGQLTTVLGREALGAASGWWEYAVSAENTFSLGPASQPSLPLHVPASDSIQATATGGATGTPKRSPGTAATSWLAALGGTPAPAPALGGGSGRGGNSFSSFAGNSFSGGNNFGGGASGSGGSGTEPSLIGRAAATLAKLFASGRRPSGAPQLRPGTPSQPLGGESDGSTTEFSLFTCAAEHEGTCTLGPLDVEPSRYLEGLLARAAASDRFPLRARTLSSRTASSRGFGSGGDTGSGGGGSGAATATYEWPVAGTWFGHGTERLQMAMDPMVDRYNTWAAPLGIEALPDSIRRYELVPSFALKVAHSGGATGGSGSGVGSSAPQEQIGRWRWAFQQVRANFLTVDVEPTRVVSMSSRAVGDDGPAGDVANAGRSMSPYEVALSSFDVAKLRVTCDVEKADDGRPSSTSVLRCNLATSLRVELPHPWYVPRVAIEAAGNVLLKVGLKLASDELLRIIHELHAEGSAHKNGTE